MARSAAASTENSTEGFTGDSTDELRRKVAARGRLVPAREQSLPVLDPLIPLLPGGVLRRGVSVAVSARPASGAVSLAMALAAGPSGAGSWVAVVGLPSIGSAAAAELGVALERLVVVDSPTDSWAKVVAALVGAFDLILVAVPARVRPVDVRRLTARARERGSVLVSVPPLPPGVGRSIRATEGPAADDPFGSDVRLCVTSAVWHGVGAGHGHLRARRVVVQSDGRREAARPRSITLWLPGPEGAVRLLTVAP